MRLWTPKPASWWQSVGDTVFLILVVPLVVAMLVLAVGTLTGCGDDEHPTPTCAELGCPVFAICNRDASECYCGGQACDPKPAPTTDAAPADANCTTVLRTCECTPDGLQGCGLGDLQWDCGCQPVDASSL